MKSPLLLIALAVILQSATARAQTGTFTIINGPGTGAVLNATGGVVNSPGPTIGNLQGGHPGCPGPQFHYHGLLVGAVDPAPGACGWGQINFPMMTGPVIGLPATVPAAPLQVQTRPVAQTPVNLTPSTAASTLAVKFDSPPTDAAFSAAPRTRSITLAALYLPGLQQSVADDDAIHAARYSPRPSARAREFRVGIKLRPHAEPIPRSREPVPPRRPSISQTEAPAPVPAWESIQLTGPEAKPTLQSGDLP